VRDSKSGDAHECETPAWEIGVINKRTARGFTVCAVIDAVQLAFDCFPETLCRIAVWESVTQL
jgi:hypothetical protein